jgi:uncharacterized protein YjbI with pentapeptide repeats
MSNYPDYDQYGYQVIQELGRNREAGRITYLATALNPEQKVVIKEFHFALADASWSGYKAHQREIEVLQQLDHPRIPRYLDSFETPQGFCLVQEYKNAPSLAEQRSLTTERIKQIAVSVLEILVDLQQRMPPIIHRDIKPENILVDKHWNAYLVDFGFARIRGGEMALSSVAAGTLGFMPPEEQFGRPLTEASDLYSLGATLICLLTGTRSLDIGKLIDDNYRFDFKRLVPQLNPGLIAWLDKMVAPNVKQRFDNAAAALKALKPMRVIDSPNRVESLVGALIGGVLMGVRQGRKRRAVVGLQAVLALATLGIVAWMGTNFIVLQPENPVRQLLTTKQCIRCFLQDANLEDANLEDASLRQIRLKDANLWHANLGGADLWHANLKNANLKNANLRRADLRGVNLKNANLEDANLVDANLEDANLKNANLRYADLRHANLEDANLKNANLRDANLGGADLWHANLRDANLSSANLGGVGLTDAKLKNANLGGADLWHANLKNANLEGAILEDANLRDANLKNANLRYADLVDANLEDANLEGAILEAANLKNANLRDANLRDANLRDANLEGANLEDANLKDAIMPDGTKHP